MFRKLFSLWNNHTVGFARLYFILLIPAAFSEAFAQFYICFLFVFDLLVRIGQHNKWDNATDFKKEHEQE